MATNRVRVYISFDYDHDEDLKNLLVGQANNVDSPFAIEDWSIKEASTGWREKARARIKRVDQVIVICGQHVDTAAGVQAEIRIAQDEGKPYFLLSGRSDGGNKRPTAARDSDKLYRWTWSNLKALIAGGR